MHLAEDSAIRSVLDLTDRSDRPMKNRPGKRPSGWESAPGSSPMPGDGRGDFVAQLDAAADVIAGSVEPPAFLPCAAGNSDRTLPGPLIE